MHWTPANPFRDFSARRLVNTCGHYIKQLQARRQRSVAEREQLTEDLCYLLIALSQHIDGPKGQPGSPEHRVGKGADLADTFRCAYQDDVRALRHGTMRRAADLALGDAAGAWFRAMRINGEEDRALGSDAALMKHLRELEAAYSERIGNAGPERA